MLRVSQLPGLGGSGLAVLTAFEADLPGGRGGGGDPSWLS